MYKIYNISQWSYYHILYFFKIPMSVPGRIISILLPVFNLFFWHTWEFMNPLKKRVCRECKTEGKNTQVYLIFTHPLNIVVPSDWPSTPLDFTCYVISPGSIGYMETVNISALGKFKLKNPPFQTFKILSRMYKNNYKCMNRGRE